MDPKLLRAMADMLENPEELARRTNQAKGRLFELATKFDQEKTRASKEDMDALAYGLCIVLSTTSSTLERMDGLCGILHMAHWLGKKEGRRLGHKQAHAERLCQNIKLHEEEK